MSRLVTMGVAVLVVCECCDSVPERAAAQPFGHLPSESYQDHICPHPVGPPALPLPPLPSHSSLGDVRTHTSYLSCVFYFLMFRVAHWLGIFTSGRGGGWFLGGGPKKGRECLEGNGGGGHQNPCSLQEQLLLPRPRIPPPSPKEVALVYSEDSVTVSLFPEI